MLGNFTFYNPVKLIFGKDALKLLAAELIQYGPRVMLSYGGGSIKRNGIYDQVMEILRITGKEVFEDPGVMPNPTIGKLKEGARIARENNVDLILAVGGGSVIDYAKGVAASAWCEEDPWEKFYMREENPSCRIIPVGSILTMVGTGSEMNGGSVITNSRSGRCSARRISRSSPSSTRNLPIRFRITRWSRASSTSCPTSWSSISPARMTTRPITSPRR